MLIFLSREAYMNNNNKSNIEWALCTLDKYSLITIKEQLGYLKLTKTQLLLIIHLKFESGIRQDHLTKIFKMNRPAITRSIKTMISLGYIDKRTDEFNRTANFIFLTPKGEEIYNEIYRVLQEWLDTITNGFTDTEVKDSICLLLRMSANACKAQGDEFVYQQIESRIQSINQE